MTDLYLNLCQLPTFYLTMTTLTEYLILITYESSLSTHAKVDFSIELYTQVPCNETLL